MPWDKVIVTYSPPRPPPTSIPSAGRSRDPAPFWVWGGVIATACAVGASMAMAAGYAWGRYDAVQDYRAALVRCDPWVLERRK